MQWLFIIIINQDKQVTNYFYFSNKLQNDMPSKMLVTQEEIDLF